MFALVGCTVFWRNGRWVGGCRKVHADCLCRFTVSFCSGIGNGLYRLRISVRLPASLTVFIAKYRNRTLTSLTTSSSQSLSTHYSLSPSTLCSALLLSKACRSDVGPTQPPVQWIPGAFSPMVKRPDPEAKPLTAIKYQC